MSRSTSLFPLAQLQHYSRLYGPKYPCFSPSLYLTYKWAQRHPLPLHLSSSSVSCPHQQPMSSPMLSSSHTPRCTLSCPCSLRAISAAAARWAAIPHVAPWTRSTVSTASACLPIRAAGSERSSACTLAWIYGVWMYAAGRGARIGHDVGGPAQLHAESSTTSYSASERLARTLQMSNPPAHYTPRTPLVL